MKINVSLDKLIKARVWEIIKDERAKNQEVEWEVVQDGIRSIDGSWNVVLLKQNRLEYTNTKFYKIVEL
jgi:hypothetical protein